MPRTIADSNSTSLPFRLYTAVRFLCMLPCLALCISLTSRLPLYPDEKEILFPDDLSLADVPFGTYSFLRSKGNITQLLVSDNLSSLTLYTDRWNKKDGEIKAASFSRVGLLRRTAPPLSQGDFKARIEDALVFGNREAESTEPFPGLDEFTSAVNGSTADMKKKGSVITVRKPIINKNGGNTESVLVIDPLRHTCTIRVCRGDKGPGTSHCSYPVYIFETGDSHLLGIIRHYYYQLYRFNKNSRTSDNR